MHLRSSLLLSSLTIAAWSVLGSGCNDAVSHGRLDRCSGGARCELAVDTLTIATETPKSCTTRREPIELAFLTSLAEAVCGGPGQCTVWVQKIAPRHDGGAWVLGSHSGDRSPRLWLTHLDVDGAVKKVVSLDDGTPLNFGGANFSADMAVNESDHAFVAVYALEVDPNANSELGEISWIQEVDAEGTLVHDRIDELGVGYPHIVWSQDDRMTVAGNALENEHRGLLGQLDTTGVVLWSTNRVPTIGTGEGRGVVGLSPAMNGDFWVFMQRGPASRMASPMALTRYDSSGTMLWDGLFDVAMENGERVGFAGGPRGHLTVMLRPQSDASTPHTQATGDDSRYSMLHVDASGRSSWAYRMEGASEPWLAVDPRDGAVYASDVNDLIRVSEDGESCERFALTPVEGVFYEPQLGAVAEDGRLWFADGSLIGSFRPTFGE